MRDRAILLKYSCRPVAQVRADQVRTLVIFLPPTLGDSVHHTATLKWLRDGFPQARLIAVTGALGTPLIRHCGLADEVWEREWGTWKLFRMLRQARADLAIFSYIQNKQVRMAKLAGVRSLAGFLGGKYDSWLDVSLEWWEGQYHFTAGIRQLLEKMGVRVGSPEYVIPRGAAQREKVDSALPPDRYAAVMVGASHPVKEWPTDRFSAVIQWLKERGFRIVNVGGPKEAGRLGSEADFDLAGVLNPPETAELLRRCSILISNDTGVMHLAGAVGCPVVGIYGPGLPFEFRPPGDHVMTLGGLCDCAIRTPETCIRECLYRVSIDEVISAAEAMLNSREEI